MQNSMEGSEKIKNRTTVWSSNPTSRQKFIQKNLKQELEEIPALPCLLHIIHNSQDVANVHHLQDVARWCKCSSTDEWGKCSMYIIALEA